MKLKVVALFFAAAFFVKCDKRHHAAEMQMSDPSPDIKLISISGYTTNAECTYPMPMDSSASVDLDVDGNGSKDFRVESRHSSDLNSNCQSSHCYCVQFKSSITALSDDGAILASTDSGDSGLPKQLNSGDEIEKKGNYVHNAILYSFGAGGCETCATFSGYIGIKIEKRYGWIKLSVSRDSVMVQKYGLSKVKNKLIKAGEE